MAKASLNHTITFKNSSSFSEYSETTLKNLAKVVDVFAYQIANLARYYVPVDQGAAKASIYVVTSKESGKESAQAEARSKALTEESRWHHKGRDLQFAPDAVEEQNVQELHALICVGVAYGYWLEVGDYQIHAKNPGVQSPYLAPAMAHFEQKFFEACRQVLNNRSYNV